MPCVCRCKELREQEEKRDEKERIPKLIVRTFVTLAIGYYMGVAAAVVAAVMFCVN